MKKIVALVLCLVMVVGLMTSCQKKMDVETLVQKMDEAMKAVTAQSADMEMDLEIKMATMGVTMTIGMDMSGQVKAKSDLSAMYMDLNMAMEALGQSEETSMEMYALLEDGAMVSYSHEDATDTWVKTVSEDYVEMMEQLQGMQMTMDKFPVELFSLAEEQVTVNDRKCYVLTMQIDGASIQEYLGDYMEQMLPQLAGSEELDEEAMAELETMMDSLDWSKLGGSAVYHVDAETFLPLENSMEVLGMGDVFNGMIETLMAEMMMEMDEEAPALSIEIPTFTVAVKNMAYNEAVEIPAVPQEAIDNAVDADSLVEDDLVGEAPMVDETMLNNPAQADGSFLLSYEGDSVSVIVPEGYAPYMSEPDVLLAMSDDYMNSVSYGVIGDVDDGYMQEYVNEMVTFAKDEDFYLSHTEPAEQDGFTVATLLYNDGTASGYAWKQLGTSFLLVEANLSAESVDMAAFLNGLKIAE